MKHLSQRAQLLFRARRAEGNRQRAAEAARFADRVRELSVASGSVRRLV